MMSFPIWSTWAQYKTQINESVVLKFANDILDNGFNNSHLEIDDNWEVCYGDAKFDSKKFPDPARVIHQLNGLGYRYCFFFIRDETGFGQIDIKS